MSQPPSQPEAAPVPQQQASHGSPSMGGQASLGMPPNKKPRISPGPPSQPGSPYPGSQYNNVPSPGVSTPGMMTPGAGIPSPVNAPLSKAPGQSGSFPSPMQRNGSVTPVPVPVPVPMPTQPPSQAPSQPATPVPANSGLPMPVASAGPIPQAIAANSQPPTPSALLPTPQASFSAPYTNATLMHIPAPGTPAPTSEMPPPPLNASVSFSGALQGKAPVKNYNYEMDDMLAGTGINLEEEQELMNDFEMREGLGSYRPGGRKALYGAGVANQPPEESDARTQEELAAEAADKAWNSAAQRLALTRTVEVTSHLLDPGLLHRKMAAIASRNNLGLNLDLRADGKTQYMGRLAAPDSFPKPAIKVSTVKATDGTIVTTHGSFIPKEAFLVDQIALLSIATREHLRGLLTDANKKSISRQQKTHGAVPAEWTPAASPGPAVTNGVDSPASAAASGVSPTTTSKKRPAGAMSNGLPTPVSDASPTVNPLAEAMRAMGKANRSAEEARFKKRQKRLDQANKEKSGADGSRAGSLAPGAETGETKAPTKKEAKKSAKLAEASSTTVNNTLSLFAGGKKKKKYSWMAGGGGGAPSGPGTPQPQAAGAPGTPGGTNMSQKSVNGSLTIAPNSRSLPGAWREDGPSGKNIQLRDWILVLEDRGLDIVALQKLYDRLDKSDLGDKERAEAES